MLHGILQCGAHTSVPSQGRTDRTRRSIGRVHQMPTCSRRLASPIRTDLIYDRDRIGISLQFHLGSVSSNASRKLPTRLSSCYRMTAAVLWVSVGAVDVVGKISASVCVRTIAGGARRALHFPLSRPTGHIPLEGEYSARQPNHWRAFSLVRRAPGLSSAGPQSGATLGR